MIRPWKDTTWSHNHDDNDDEDDGDDADDADDGDDGDDGDGTLTEFSSINYLLLSLKLNHRALTKISVMQLKRSSKTWVKTTSNFLSLLNYKLLWMHFLMASSDLLKFWIFETSIQSHSVISDISNSTS